jgi:hypothetical protein
MASVHQKHPVPKVAVSVLSLVAAALINDELMDLLFFSELQENNEQKPNMVINALGIIQKLGLQISK